LSCITKKIDELHRQIGKLKVTIKINHLCSVKEGLMHVTKHFMRLLMICFLAGLICFVAAPSLLADGEGPAVQLLLLLDKPIVEVTADINSNTTWKSSNIYVIRASDFYVNAILTIEPGTTIKFHPDDGPYMLLGIGTGGKILANGTAASPIVFTSYRDDANGGDTNKDGTATSPAAGDWFYIGTNGEQDSVFNYCHFLYGGGGSYIHTLELYYSRATVTNCVFAHNRGGPDGDFYDGALDASDALDGTVIEGNRFYDNILPLSIGWQFDVDDSNTFQSADGLQKNTYNAIFYNSTDNIEGDLSWGETEVAFVIDDNDLWVNSGYQLTLGNNVVLKFTAGSTLLLDDGESALVNRNGPGVYFTSYRDDSRKGDANGDGASTSPANGDWEGIYDNTLTIPSPYFFLWPNIGYDSYP
jgi:hypothetical protein